MMIRRIEVSLEARNDLLDIRGYVAANSPAAASRLLREIRDKFRLLQQHPLIGQLREELQPEIRSFSVGNYVIYYVATEASLRIVRVLHGARDVYGHFRASP